MTQSKDMPKEIYVFPDPQSIGDRGFTTTEPEKTCEDMDYTKYIRADLTPQSPNRAVLEELKTTIQRAQNQPENLFHLNHAISLIEALKQSTAKDGV